MLASFLFNCALNGEHGLRRVVVACELDEDAAMLDTTECKNEILMKRRKMMNTDLDSRRNTVNAFSDTEFRIVLRRSVIWSLCIKARKCRGLNPSVRVFHIERYGSHTLGGQGALGRRRSRTARRVGVIGPHQPATSVWHYVVERCTRAERCATSLHALGWSRAC